MASKADELKAWKKLEAFAKEHHETVSLETEYRNYSIEDSGKYRAYLTNSSEFNHSNYFSTPMEAVDDRISKWKEAHKE